MEELMRYAHVSLAAAMLTCVLAAPASAADPRWGFRVFAAGFDPDTRETIVNPEGRQIEVVAGSALGAGAGLEYCFTPHIGLDLGVMAGTPEIELSQDVPIIGRVSLSDSMTTVVGTADLLVHLTPGRSVDVYVGAGVAGIRYGDLSYGLADLGSFDVSVEDDVTWSVRAGIDIALGADSGWSAVGGVRYIPSKLDVWQIGTPADDTVSFDFNIFSFTVGVGYRF
jgi:outer membrane protein W